MRILNEEKSDLDVGSQIELEHLPTFYKIKEYFYKNNKFPEIQQVADWIRDDHLREFINYYDDKDGLPEMERRLKSN